jgi:hypothetical protein
VELEILMTITPETTLAELGAHMKSHGFALRVCPLGTGYIVFFKGGHREAIGYGRELAEAVNDARQNYSRESEPVWMPQAAPV